MLAHTKCGWKPVTYEGVLPLLLLDLSPRVAEGATAAPAPGSVPAAAGHQSRAKAGGRLPSPVQHRGGLPPAAAAAATAQRMGRPPTVPGRATKSRPGLDCRRRASAAEERRIKDGILEEVQKQRELN